MLMAAGTSGPGEGDREVEVQRGPMSLGPRVGTANMASECVRTGVYFDVQQGAVGGNPAEQWTLSPLKRSPQVLREEYVVSEHKLTAQV